MLCVRINNNKFGRGGPVHSRGQQTSSTVLMAHVAKKVRLLQFISLWSMCSNLATMEKDDIAYRFVSYLFPNICGLNAADYQILNSISSEQMHNKFDPQIKSKNLTPDVPLQSIPLLQRELFFFHTPRNPVSGNMHV